MPTISATVMSSARRDSKSVKEKNLLVVVAEDVESESALVEADPKAEGLVWPSLVIDSVR